MKKKKEKFLILDGSSLVYRAFFALPLLQTKQGLYTNAVYGFTTMLIRLLTDEQPDYVAVAFERAKKLFVMTIIVSIRQGGKKRRKSWQNSCRWCVKF